MTPKELTIIQNCIRNAKASIEVLACDNYPFSEFKDPDLRDMFYSLNDMSQAITRKLEEMEADA